MKHPLLKSVIVLGAALALVNCGEENLADAAAAASNAATNTDIPAINAPVDNPVNNPVDPSSIAVNEPSWVISTDKTYLISTTTMAVTDVAGNPVGVYDPASQIIVDLAGVPLVDNVDFTLLPIVLPQGATSITQEQPGNTVVTDPTTSKDPVVNNPTTDPTNPVLTPASSSSVKQNSTASSSSVANNNNNTAKSSSSAQQQQGAAGVTVTGNLTQTVAAGAQTTKISFSGLSSKDEVSRDWKAYFLTESFENGTYTISPSTIPDHFAGQTVTETFTIKGTAYKFVITVSGGSNNNNNNNQQQSSSSQQQQQQKSSSSQAKSSSSQQQQQAQSSSSQQQQGATPNFVIKGQTKHGYATRYWDSCKPHCAWEGKEGPATTPTRTCHADGSIAGTGEASACDGGPAGTCLSQIPKIINDNLAYAFAASPGGQGDCGRCYLLTFDGKGHDQSPARNQALKGKQLVIMSSNIGYDVAGGQFDIMIPGGGVGAFSGCKQMGLSCAGKQYGGLLGSCQDQYNDNETKLKECLTSSCKQEYGNNADALEGCLFMATWMNAADNPTHDYVEIECPAELAARW